MTEQQILREWENIVRIPKDCLGKKEATINRDSEIRAWKKHLERLRNK